jgi:hypothetical protein
MIYRHDTLRNSKPAAGTTTGTTTGTLHKPRLTSLSHTTTAILVPRFSFTLCNNNAFFFGVNAKRKTDFTAHWSLVEIP